MKTFYNILFFTLNTIYQIATSISYMNKDYSFTEHIKDVCLGLAIFCIGLLLTKNIKDDEHNRFQ